MLWRTLTVLTALVALLVGTLQTSLPSTMGLYRFLTYWKPALIGYIPAFHDGIPWRFTFAELSTLNLTGQTALVTGANAGIGYALTEALYRLGAARVTLACRNPSKCRAAAKRIREDNHHHAGAKGTLVTATVDTGSLASVRQFAMNYWNDNANAFSLDMLFLNAGTAFDDTTSPCVPLSVDGIEQVFATNYLGHHLLFRWLEPALRPGARVVSTSSSGSFDTYSYAVATDLETLNGCREPFVQRIENLSYGQSKLAQILWTKYLTRRHLPNSHNGFHDNTAFYINAFHPGLCATELADKRLTEGKAPQMVRALLHWAERHLMWTAREGALTGLFLGTAVHRLEREQVRGQYFHPQSQPVVHELALNETLQDQLWAFSEALVENFLPPAATINNG